MLVRQARSPSTARDTTLSVVVSVGDDKYAIPCRDVVEVVPSVPLARLALAPSCVAGAFTYRGKVATVLDLDSVLLGTPCPIRLSSRIIMVSSGAERSIGLLTERVCSIVRLELSADCGTRLTTVPAVVATLRHEGELIRVLDVNAVIPKGLFEAEGAPEARRP
jgi:chemotaxis-related protein WspB